MIQIVRRDSTFRARKLLRAAASFACMGLVFAISANAADAPGPTASGGMSPLIGWIAGIGLVILVLFPVGSLVWWSRKQDEINNMMAFCRRSLMLARDESARVEAASSLGEARDPEALLVLVDVVTDEQAEESVRQAARASLEEMAKKYRKYQAVIQSLLSAIDNSELGVLIKILIANFESAGKGHVQSAYVIAREYLRLEQYEEARSWFRKAKARNRKAAVYQGKIEPSIDACNENLVVAGDRLFQEGKYNEAKRLYAAASSGLDSRQKQDLCPHLRMACVYCRLGNYDGADQATLQALRLQQETELALSLNDLIQQRLEKCGAGIRGREDCSAQDSALDNHVSQIMEKLIGQLLAEHARAA